MQQLFNPGPSSLRTARMLNYRTPKVQTSFQGLKSGHGVGPIPRLARADGGGIPDSPDQPFTGPIVSNGAGRTDTVPMHVPSGSYVLPADIVSHMGQGNSIAGLQLAHMMFGPHPLNTTTGPWGVGIGKPVKGKGVPMPRPRKPPVLGATAMPKPTPAGPAPMQAHGGEVEGSAPATPIAASGGEFVIPPAEVKRRGGGDLGKGHRTLDLFVKSIRDDHIKTLQNLPGPAQD